MAEIECDYEGCTFKCPATAIAALVQHAITTHASPPPPPPPVHNPVPAPAQTVRQPRIDRPRIDIGCDPHVWETFVWKWERFRQGSGITDATANIQLLHCLSDPLLVAAKRSAPGLENLDVADALREIKLIAILPVALGVRQTRALETKQDENERFRMFVGRIRERIVDCDFRTACPHAPAGRMTCSVPHCDGHDYTDAIIMLVALNGIRDPDIKKEVLSVDNLRAKSINDIISLVEHKEVARDQSRGPPEVAATAALSAFKKGRKSGPNASTTVQPQPGDRRPPNEEKKLKIVAPTQKKCNCGNDFFDYVARKNGSCNQRPYEECRACFMKSKGSKKLAAAELSETDSDECITARMSAIRLVAEPPVDGLAAFVASSEASPGEHPRLDVRFSIPTVDGPRDIAVNGAVADSGAQVCIVPAKLTRRLPSLCIAKNAAYAHLKGADNNDLDVVAVVDASLSAISNTGDRITTTVRLYVVEGVDECYISCNAMKGLRIIDEHFPQPGVKDHDCRLCATTTTSTCRCIPRSLPPSRHPNQPPRWNRSGIITETRPHGAYIVKMDGSGRVSQRTRAHLKPVFLPFSPGVKHTLSPPLPDALPQGLVRPAESRRCIQTPPELEQRQQDGCSMPPPETTPVPPPRPPTATSDRREQQQPQQLPSGFPPPCRSPQGQRPQQPDGLSCSTGGSDSSSPPQDQYSQHRWPRSSGKPPSRPPATPTGSARPPETPAQDPRPRAPEGREVEEQRGRGVGSEGESEEPRRSTRDRRPPRRFSPSR